MTITTQIKTKKQKTKKKQINDQCIKGNNDTKCRQSIFRILVQFWQSSYVTSAHKQTQR